MTQLFNGVLRLRVQKVEDLGRQWGVTVEVRNGTSKRLSTTAATGIDIYSEELSLGDHRRQLPDQFQRRRRLVTGDPAGPATGGRFRGSEGIREARRGNASETGVHP